MSTDSHAPRPYTCPDCGHQHAADLHAMVGHPEIHGKVPCQGCGHMLWLSLDEHGVAIVELYEAHLHEAQHAHRVREHAERRRSEAADAVHAAAGLAAAGIGPDAASSAVADEPTAASSRPSVFAQLLATAIVAAVVSLIVVGAMRNEGATAGPRGPQLGEHGAGDGLPPPAAEPDGLQDDVAVLRKAVGDMQVELKAVGAQVSTVARTLEQQTSASDAADDAELHATLDALRADYKALHGRIEGNYTTLRQIAKRLESLESP